MCIRDSHLAVHREELRLVLSSIDDILWSQNLEGKLEWINPVSYTHLRAHETVLDLVCRLLLEKTKQTNIDITHIQHTDVQHTSSRPYRP